MTPQLKTQNTHKNHLLRQRASRLPAILWSFISAIGVAALLVLTPTPAVNARSAVAIPVAPLPPVTVTGSHMGLCYANYPMGGDQYVTPLAANAGARWDRVDFAWDRIESQPGSFSFGGYDDLVTRDATYGLGTVGILMATPAWAANCNAVSAATARTSGLADPPFLPLRTTSLAATSKCPPKNLTLAWDHPDNYWGRFVRETVRRYRGSVHVWEIWNEPDLYDFFWTGSVADYAQLLKVGYLSIKAEDPSATVLFAGLAYWANPGYYVSVLDHLKAMPGASDHNYYFDVMSLHLYSSVYTIGPVVASIQAAMAQRVGPHPIWLTEAGVPLWDEVPGASDDYKLNRATAAEAASYVIQAFGQARVAGIEKFFFFRTHDDGMAEGLFGLIRDDWSFRPAYVAYQVAATYLHGENQVSRPAVTPEGVQRITFWGTPRGRVDVLWNVTGEAMQYTYPTLLPEVTVVTERGTVTTLSSSGSVTLPLAAATANTGEGGSLLIGGSPLLVIHEDTVPPTSQLHALPSVWYGSAVTLTWNVADNAGPGRPGTGHWYTEIQRAPAPTGPWTTAAGWPLTQHTTSAVASIPTGGIWYFRARARDGAGNWESWPVGAETQTKVILDRTVTIDVTSYIDANSSGVRDTGEVPTTTTTLAWTTTGGTLIGTHDGPAWTLTQSVLAGDYVITARAPGHLPAVHRFTVTAGPDPQHVTVDLGLRPVKSVLRFPLIRR